MAQPVGVAGGPARLPPKPPKPSPVSKGISAITAPVQHAAQTITHAVAPPRPPRPRGGSDAVSSGSDYGSAKVTSYKATPKYAAAVKAVFAHQPVKQKAAIIVGSSRNAQSDPYTAKAVREAMDELPIFEKTTLAKYLPHNTGITPGQLVGDIGHIFNPKTVYGSTGKAGQGGLVGSVTPFASGTLGRKVVLNTGKDAVNLPAEAFSTVGTLGSDVLSGNVKKGLSDVTSPFVQLAQHPLKTFVNHPLDTYLMVAGALHGATRPIAGAARAVAPADSGFGRLLARERPSIALTGRLTHERPPTSPYPLIQAAQKISDRAKLRKTPEGSLVTRRQALQDKLTALETSREVGMTERVRRANRDAAHETRLKSVQPSRAVRAAKQTARALAYGRKPSTITGAEALSLIPDATIRSAKTMAGDIRKYVQMASSNRGNLLDRPDMLAEHDKTVSALNDLANRIDKGKVDKQALFKAAQSYAKDYNPLQKAAAKFGQFGERSKEALDQRMLAHYAITHMGAKYDPELEALTLNRMVREASTGGPSVRFAARPHEYRPGAVDISGKTWYHGTNVKNLTAEGLDSSGTNEANLFGQGVYLTDNPDVAKGYAEARSRRSGEPTVYRARVHIKNALDLEANANPKFAGVLATRLRNLVGIGDHEAAAQLERLAKQPGVTNEALYKAFTSAVADFSHSEEIPRSELVEDFQILASDLRKQGFDALTHVGGKRVGARTGGPLHQVAILLDTANVDGLEGASRQAREFSPIAGAAERQPLRTTTKAVRVPNSVIREHMRANGVSHELAFTSDKAHPDSAFYVSSDRRPLPESARNTYFAYTHGLTDTSHDSLLRQHVRMQGIVDAHKAQNRLLEQVAVQKPGGGYWSTFKDAKAASPGRGYVPVRVGQAFHPQAALDQALEGVDPTRLDEEAQLHGLDFSNRLHDSGPGKYALISKVALDRIEQHKSALTPNLGQRAFSSLNNQFRRVALSTSAKHVPGVASEQLIRDIASGVGLSSWITGHRIISRIEKSGSEEAANVRTRLTGGQLAGATQMATRHFVAERYQGTSLYRPLKSFEKFMEAPGPRQLSTAWRAWTTFAIGATKRVLEEQHQIADIGKAALVDFSSEHGPFFKALRLQGQMIDDAAKGLFDPAKQRQFRVQTERIRGRWNDLTPHGQMALMYSPFGLWWINSVKWLARAPIDQPVLTGALAAATVGTEKERQAHGLDMFSAGRLPDYMQGGIPLGGGRILAQNYYSPFGVANDPFQTGVSLGEPWALPVAFAGYGVDWKGDPINSPGDPHGDKKANTGERIGVALNSVLSSFIPLYTKAEQIAVGGASEYDTSGLATGIQTKAPGKGPAAGLAKALTPYRSYASPAAQTSSSGSGVWGSGASSGGIWSGSGSSRGVWGG